MATEHNAVPEVLSVTPRIAEQTMVIHTSVKTSQQRGHLIALIFPRYLNEIVSLGCPADLLICLLNAIKHQPTCVVLGTRDKKKK